MDEQSLFELLKADHGFLWSAIGEIQQEDFVTFATQEADARIAVTSLIFPSHRSQFFPLLELVQQAGAADQRTNNHQEPVGHDQQPYQTDSRCRIPTIEASRLQQLGRMLRFFVPARAPEIHAAFSGVGLI
jgi:hypothetical protein